MNDRMLFLIIVTFMVLLSACGGESTATLIPPTQTPIPPTPTPIPITAQESIELLDAWGFRPLLSSNGRVEWDETGKITVADGEMSVAFAMDKSPQMHFIEDTDDKHFEFAEPMPSGDSKLSVIFVSSETPGAHAEIPDFTPMTTEEVVPVQLDDRDSTISYLRVNQFEAYEGDYEFQIGLGGLGMSGFSAFDTNVFYDGAEHHIYGEVELFGVEFKNDSQDPLVFKISGDKYVYASGSGTATTEDGKSISFGE